MKTKHPGDGKEKDDASGPLKKMLNDLSDNQGKIDFEKAKDLIGDTTNTVPGSSER